MARYQIILAYDGTDYHGFQRQAHAPTVQGAVEKALRKLPWSGHSILAAGRTDSGVHAKGQVIAFDLDWAHSPDDLRSALNANLPSDIAAREVKVVPPDFHPRFDAVMRKYQYYIFSQEIRDPLRERYNWRVWPPPNIQLLQDASHHIIGDHDFTAFSSPTHFEGSTYRTISQASWTQDNDMIVFEIVSKAFLYHMVRRLVAIQVSIGQRMLDLQELKNYFTLSNDKSSGNQLIYNKIAPPQGLFLCEVSYTREVAA